MRLGEEYKRKIERNHRENMMSASATQGGHNKSSGKKNNMESTLCLGVTELLF